MSASEIVEPCLRQRNVHSQPGTGILVTGTTTKQCMTGRNLTEFEHFQTTMRTKLPFRKESF